MARSFLPALSLALAVSACSQSPLADPQAPVSERAATGRTAGAPAPEARTPEQFDTTSAAARAEAAGAPGTPERALGRTIASLGDPADPGFWAETPLVDRTTPGRLVDPATGRSAQVELRPRDAAAGAGTQVSLPALRLLGVPLTALPELLVYASAP